MSGVGGAGADASFRVGSGDRVAAWESLRAFLPLPPCDLGLASSRPRAAACAPAAPRPAPRRPPLRAFDPAELLLTPVLKPLQQDVRLGWPTPPSLPPSSPCLCSSLRTARRQDESRPGRSLSRRPQDADPLSLDLLPVPLRGAYKYVAELYKKKQSDVMRFLMRVRYVPSSLSSRCAHRAGAARRQELSPGTASTAKQLARTSADRLPPAPPPSPSSALSPLLLARALPPSPVYLPLSPARARCWEYRQLAVCHRASRPSRPDKARRLGYKAKQGYLIYRIRVRRGNRKKPVKKGCVPSSWLRSREGMGEAGRSNSSGGAAGLRD